MNRNIYDNEFGGNMWNCGNQKSKTTKRISKIRVAFTLFENSDMWTLHFSRGLKTHVVQKSGEYPEGSSLFEYTMNGSIFFFIWHCLYFIRHNILYKEWEYFVFHLTLYFVQTTDMLRGLHDANIWIWILRGQQSSLDSLKTVTNQNLTRKHTMLIRLRSVKQQDQKTEARVIYLQDSIHKIQHLDIHRCYELHYLPTKLS